MPNNSNWQEVTEDESDFSIESNNERSTLTLKKVDQQRFYRCTARNDIGKDYFVWKVIPVTGVPPLTAVSKKVDVDEGNNAKLSCRVVKFVSQQVDWSFNNIALQLGPRMRVVNSTFNGTVYNTLHITNVNTSDSGKYKCSSNFNRVKSEAEIMLNVQELTAPTVSVKSLTEKQGSSFLVPCDVRGHPKPDIAWKKDGKILSVHEDFVKGTDDCSSRVGGFYMLSNDVQNSGSVLVICKADYMKHRGQFSCIARNKLGNDTAKAFIDIRAPPQINEFPSPTVELGEVFSLKCVANGNPKPRIWWEKKDAESSTFKRVNNERSYELYFEKVDRNILGSYRCLAENGIKKVIRNFTLALTPRVSASAGHVKVSNEYPIVIGCVSASVVVLVIIVAVVLYKRKKAYGGFYILTLPPLPDYIKKLDPHTPLSEQTNKLPYDAEWEFPRNRLKFSRELGSGAFGKVYLADALGIVAFDPRGSTKKRSSRRRFGGSVRRNHYVNNNKMTKVAVKVLKEDSGETEYKDLLSELKILIHVGEHKNIVNLLGACTKGRESELWVIIEFCSNGNLLQFLRNRRDIYETEWKGVSKDPNVQLTMTDLVIAAYQVARGMEFLASRMCIHRDLATRNILVTDNYVIKIADFGLARDVGEDSQYVKTSTGLLPVKWMAIEAIIQRLFTEKSDVWSFGIVLWELFTLGGTPYPNISPNEVAEFLARGFRMEPPHACPDEISTLMINCWQEDKDCRPTFKELVEILDKIIELHTSSEGGRGYLEVQGEVMNEYLSPSDVKTPEMDPFQCNSPLPPIPSPGDNENDSLLLKDQNERKGKFQFDKAIRNKGRKDSEIEKMQNDYRPEVIKMADVIKMPDVKCINGNEHDGYIDTSLTGKEKERIERDLEKDRDSSEEPNHVGADYAYWKKSLV
ncbi:fibroblast growth factor receptor 2-like [Dendronephthya gigantea]|uniref:fibroblast growth factor receptor 2-like n=1 Tax=Dendronephthya gigantea TaxID=151771 RepID=UPI00106BB9C0|nr:fibroblast growth factor receptor 2-like [Dendronephthya gigantea]